MFYVCSLFIPIVRVKQYPALSTHKGYDDALCHGDVTLSFQHSSQSLSSDERRKILQIKRKTEDTVDQRLQEAADKAPVEAIKKLIKT